MMKIRRPSSSAKKCGGSVQVAREKRPPIDDARKKDENRVACTLARAVSRNAFARVRRDPSGFSVFPGSVVVKDEREDTLHRGFIFFVSSPTMWPPVTKRGGGKRDRFMYKRNESTTKTHKAPFFFLQPKRTTDRHRDHGAGCSLRRLPGSVHAAQNVIAQVAEGEPFLVDVAWGAFCPPFVLVGARRVGAIGLVERERREIKYVTIANRYKTHRKGRRKSACV